MRKYTLALCLVALLLVIPASARVHHHRPRENKNFFPATSVSVALENEAADTIGAQRYMTQHDVDRAVYEGKLISLIGLCVDHKLPYNRRYALPAVVDFVYTLSMEFKQQFQKCPVVDSAVRAATVQKQLQRRNKNAAPAYGPEVSSHEFGTTIDISRNLSKPQYRWLVVKLMYYRAIGRILVIEETRTHCFHIFVKGE